MEEKRSDAEKYSIFDSAVELHTDEDETLSLSDLPLIQRNEESCEKELNNRIQEDFDFCSVSKQPEMCAADELFFQGQILPLRSMTRSESMDHLRAGLISSRSSSISSLQSSSSGSSAGPKSRPKLPPARNQFHSHPSPSPRVHFSTKKPNPNHRNHNCPKKSAASVWDLLRLGILTTPPEIAFQDLKSRNQSIQQTSRNFGSRNSTDSNSSSISGSNINNNNNNNWKVMRKKNLSLLGGCKCSADAVDTRSGAVIKRSASENELMEAEKLLVKKRSSRKKHVSHHRTFEWLKQLSLEDEDIVVTRRT